MGAFMFFYFFHEFSKSCHMSFLIIFLILRELFSSKKQLKISLSLQISKRVTHFLFSHIHGSLIIKNKREMQNYEKYDIFYLSHIVLWVHGLLREGSYPKHGTKKRVTHGMILNRFFKFVDLSRWDPFWVAKSQNLNMWCYFASSLYFARTFHFVVISPMNTQFSCHMSTFWARYVLEVNQINDPLLIWTISTCRAQKRE